MKVNLGGDRLGSGHKIMVDTTTFNRSTFNKNQIFRTTMAAGTLVPCLNEVGLPGDTWDISINAECLTHPTVGPLFGSNKVQVDVFTADWRLYNSHLHNNRVNIGMKMQDVKLPVIQYAIGADAVVPTDWNTSQVNPSSLNAYLGLRGYGLNLTNGTVFRTFQAIRQLMYADTYKNYYANKQEGIGAVIHTPLVNLVSTVDEIVAGINNDIPIAGPTATTGSEDTYGLRLNITYTGLPHTPPEQIYLMTNKGYMNLREYNGNNFNYDDTTWYADLAKWGSDLTINYWKYVTNADLNNVKPGIETFDLEDIDDMREWLLQQGTYLPVKLNDANGGNGYMPYKRLYGGTNVQQYIKCSQEGLLLKTYQSDINQTWLREDWVTGADSGIAAVTAVPVIGGVFQLDTLNVMKKVYNMLNDIMVSGGSYDDYMGAVYQQNDFTRPYSPVYHGGLSKELVFQQVVSNATAENQDGTQPLGTLAGRGVMNNKHKGGHVTIKPKEITQIMALVSITPRVDYSQGNDWEMQLTSPYDLHKPHLDGIGFEESINEEKAWWTTTWDAGTSKWIKTSAGRRPAWSNYQTAVNKTFGNFAIKDNEMFMTNNRRYEFGLNQTNTLGIIKDLTTYIDPSKFNNIFAQTSLDAQNFWMQIAFDITVRRLMSSRNMPHI